MTSFTDYGKSAMIILESAYSLHDRAFFSNLGTILLYALMGTLINCFTIGPSLYGLAIVGALGPISVGITECLVFSSLISAVDPVAVLAIFQEIGVNKVLYFLVFGESLLNDAVTIVLYTMMVGLSSTSHVTAGQVATGIAAFFCVSLGGLLIGILMGIITALVTRLTQKVRVVEPLALLGIAYLSYLLAEMVHFSGIISIIACGLVQAQYARFNISQKSYITVKYFIKMLSAICDTLIFLFLGMVLVNDNHIWHTGFVLWTVALCLIARFCSVYVLTFLANYFERLHNINIEEQFVMAYGGLRGAVAFSLVIMLDKKTVPNKSLFITATLFMVLFTVFIQGSTVKPLVNLLKIRTQKKENYRLFQEVNTKVIDNMMAGIEEVTGNHSENYWKKILCYYDDRYFKKWLQHTKTDNSLTRVYTKTVLADHFAHLYGPATALEDKQPLMLNQAIDEDITDAMDDGIIYKQNEDTILFSKKKAFKSAKVHVGATRNFQVLLQEINHASQEDTESQPVKEQKLSISSSFKLTRPETEDDPSNLLLRALQNNPYNKYHQKYNRDLIGDDQQELASHMHARRMRAKRLTLSAVSRKANCKTLPFDGDDHHSTSEQDITASNYLEQRPYTAPRLFTGNPLYDSATNIFLELAQKRQSIMSGKSDSAHVKSVSVSLSSPATGGHNTQFEKYEEPADTVNESLQIASLESIEEELENKNGSSLDPKDHINKRVRLVTPISPAKMEE
ncbi:sodium/hydrogen exchanger 2-like [Limulus polyphemus]|uniref:Sodium/hydrogen exchanger n=1 Tax=Limulus polyphemus TaxID=6850 RepID=A0ABM1SRC1_LIMPO|nr:sodium/hydrogen exchanger 2-like [Limulus polyphemus]